MTTSELNASLPDALEKLVGAGQSETLARSGERQVGGRRIEKLGNYSETYLSINIGGYDVVTISSRVRSDKTATYSVAVGAFIPKETMIHFYRWSTENNGERQSSGGQRSQADILEKGYPKIESAHELPREIDVEAAVRYWLGEMQAAVAEPSKLQGIDFSINNLVGQFNKVDKV